MSHKRVSQLVEITAPEVMEGDLFYIIDVSAREGKKIQVSSLSAYLNASGSLYAISAITSDTASYIAGSNVVGPVATSSFSTTANSASYSTFALSASFASNGGSGGSGITLVTASLYDITSSWALNAVNATNAVTASVGPRLIAGSTNPMTILGHLSGLGGWYSTGITSQNGIITASLFNGTASFANNAQNTFQSVHSTYAIISTYADTASFTYLANAATASELAYPNNSTASYAMVSENFSYNGFIDRGVFSATSQSITSSQLDLVIISSSLGGFKQTNIRAVGTVIVPYTSSIVVDELLSLIAISRDEGTEITIDSTPIYFDVSRTVNNWDGLMSGSIKIPYTLEGSASMRGEYLVIVTGSSDVVRIESTRTNKFNISSLSDSVTVSGAEQLLFNLTPSNTVLIEFYTGSHQGPVYDYRNGMVASGSPLIESVNVANSFVDEIRYVWTLPNLTTLICDQNFNLETLKKMPDTLISLSCVSCSISSITSLENTATAYFTCGANELSSLPDLSPSISYLDCSGNNLTTLPDFPDSMSYLDCSNNSISVLPLTIPYGVTYFNLDSNDMVNLSSILPETLITMSFSDNPLYILSSVWPTSLRTVYANSCSLINFPDIAPSMSYISIQNCALTQTAMDTVCSQALATGVGTGSLFLTGNGSLLSSTITTYVYPLVANYWTVVADNYP